MYTSRSVKRSPQTEENDFLKILSTVIKKGKTEITDIWVNTKDNPPQELYKSHLINMKYETSYNTS